jgi:hypothetical protein
MTFSYDQLKTIQREVRDTFPDSLSLRTHRALSWLNRAEQEKEDEDARFIFLWIAFNAAYANEIHNRQDFSEKRLLLSFLHRLIDADGDNLLYKAVWEHFPKSIRLLLGNKYVFQPFWDYQNGRIDEEEWLALFERSKYAANRALGRMDTKKVLAIVFDRLYVLRNQIVHGGSTWNSGVNRSQVTDSANILGLIVPIVIHLMMENAHQGWGDPCYPVVDS